MIADNRIALSGGWDEQKLREQLAALQDENFDLALLGFDDAELAQRLADQDAAGLTDEDDVPAIPINPVTRQGDLWVLSAGKGQPHRLLCGDATNTEDAARLLGGQQAPVLMVTDPPYGVGVEPEWRQAAGLNPRTRQGGKFTGDDRIDWSRAWVLFPGDVAYVWHAGIHAAPVALGLEQCGFRNPLANHLGEATLCHWPRPLSLGSRAGMVHGSERPERTLAGWPQADDGVGSRQSESIRRRGDGENEATGHATQKPVEVMRRPILNHTRPGEACYDPFLGSGTTLIAAETVGRVCYSIELDPRYVDVAVQRWQQFTGKDAVLEGDGRTFAQIARARRKEVA